ncbi:MAG: hypothetical protein D6775_16130 [Caldilineae bacterium]|nr:MAG: hypothetical protein D6775_16130 [Caldilineae bacterium]
MQAFSFGELQTAVIMFLLIGFFAFQGARNGFIAELIKAGFIILGVAVGRPALLGDSVVRTLNGIYQALLFLAYGGGKAVLTGDVSPEAFSRAFMRVQAARPLISPDDKLIATFLLMIALIIIGLIAGNKLRSRGGPILGLLLGAFNGLLLAYLFIPLLPRDLPPLPTSPQAARPAILGLLDVFDVIFRIVVLPFAILFGNLGTWSIPILILALLLYVGWRGASSR